MPNCFTLTPIGSSEPASLAAVDEAICAHLDIPCDKTFYAHGWYDTIGFLLACGRSFDQIKVRGELEQIRRFLAANYTSDCWAEIGHRS